MKLFTSFTLLSCLLLAFFVGLGGAASAQTSKSEIQTELQKALPQLPTKSTTAKLKPETRKAIEDTRKLYEEGLELNKMNAADSEAYLKRVQENAEHLRAVAEDRSCIQRCVDERNQCIVDRCGTNVPLWPCTCCIPCNIIMSLCITDCLVNIEVGIGKTKQETEGPRR